MIETLFVALAVILVWPFLERWWLYMDRAERRSLRRIRNGRR